MALKPTDSWIRVTDSGKGFTLVIGGKMYTGSLTTLKKLINGKVKAVNLSEIVPEEEE